MWRRKTAAPECWPQVSLVQDWAAGGAAAGRIRAVIAGSIHREGRGRISGRRYFASRRECLLQLGKLKRHAGRRKLAERVPKRHDPVPALLVQRYGKVVASVEALVDELGEGRAGAELNKGPRPVLVKSFDLLSKSDRPGELMCEDLPDCGGIRRVRCRFRVREYRHLGRGKFYPVQEFAERGGGFRDQRRMECRGNA